ncbi:MAG: DUF2207 domain-containing protein [Oxalobacter sp.]|nr:DUF2207 domain-containing protein [Oxalobacter sp.]
MKALTRILKRAWLPLLLFLSAFVAIIPSQAIADGKGKTSANRIADNDSHALKAEKAKKSRGWERIIDYDVSAVVDRDASMTVTERLKFHVENRSIKHGITRTYPIRMRDGEDGLYKFGFELLSTRLDGEEVPCRSSQKGLMVGMAIGDAKKTVSKGEHTYEIVYKTSGHVRPLDDHDEIYYNVIGSDVAFPVDRASFTLTLPDSTKPLLTKAYTGRKGSQGEDYRMTGGMSFETTRRLYPHEAFTVVVGWPKGIVNIPERPWIQTHRKVVLAAILGIVIIILMTGYFLRFTGNRPVIYPIFAPPEDLTPGKAAQTNSGKFTPLMLQADLIWCAIKGYCKMDTSNPDRTEFNWAGEAPPPPMPGTRKRQVKRAAKDANDLPGKIANTLFSQEDKIVLGFESGRPKRPHSSLTSAWNNLYRYYKPRLKGLVNYRIWTPVTALVAGYLLMYLVLDDIWQPGFEGNMTILDMLWIPGIICGFGMFCIMWAIYSWDRHSYRPVKRIFVCTGLILLGVIAFFTLWLLFSYDWFFTIFYWLLWLLPALFGMKWHSVPSEAGQKELQVTEGLKMYINTAEKHRLEAINAPEDSIEHYETILPYAIALGCIDAWQKRYAPILSRLNYVPDWLERPPMASGIVWNARQHLRYDEALRNSMFSAVTAVPVTATDAINQAIANSQETKSFISSTGGWSGGRGGGGFSGGGSGGGGVGGW